MNAEKKSVEAIASRVWQSKRESEAAQMVDNRSLSIAQAKMVELIQCQDGNEEDEELLQGKFVGQQQPEANAPGQLKPDTTTGQQLLGHELAHVVQQAEGRVQPTTEVGGIAVNDDVGLEHEADVLGARAAR